MKNEELKSRRGLARPAGIFCIFSFAFLFLTARAEDIGDLSISADAMYTGNTFHGYAETRVTILNHSSSTAHLVTLAYPFNAFGAGNSINRLARTVAVAAGARVVVPLLQPPLPANGNSMMDVTVDGHRDGEPHLIRVPNGNNHIEAGSTYGGSTWPAVALISRSLDYDAAARILDSGRGPFSAMMATGPEDAGGSYGYIQTAWMPDTRRSGETNWLELDYADPMIISEITIHATQALPPGGQISLISVTGKDIVHLSMASGTSIGGRRTMINFSFANTSEAIKTVRLDFGKTLPGSIGVDAVQVSGGTGTAWASDARASSDNSAAGPRYSPGRRSSSGTEETASLRAESSVSEWSENWLAYTPFELLMLNAADVDAMPPAIVNALGNYLAAGGNVVVFGKKTVPEAWRSPGKTLWRDGTEHQVGFGRCLILDGENPAAVDPKTVQTLRGLVNASAHYWQSLPRDGDAANGAFPVVANLKIPVRGIVVIMLAFIIVIGPVNIIWLSRRKRRTWMLWTIPAISFATTLFVFAYSLLREGITPDTRIAGLTVLDQNSHHAATVGAMAFYCPLTPGGGLHFDYETEATPLIHVGYDGSGVRREVDWTQTQHFNRGWVSARVPAHFHVRKSEARRERIQIITENGQMQIINGLGAPIKSIWFADAEMNFYEASNIAAGQKSGLILAKATVPMEKAAAAGLLRDLNFTAQPETLKDTAGKYLQPGTYLAVLDGNPFIENALGSAASAKRTKSSAVVFGILDAENLAGGAK